MLPVIIATALLNVGLGFALAVYVARRHQLLVAGNTDSSLSAAQPPVSATATGNSQRPAGEPLRGPTTAEAGAVSVKGLQKKVEQYHQQLAEVEALLDKK